MIIHLRLQLTIFRLILKPAKYIKRIQKIFMRKK